MSSGAGKRYGNGKRAGWKCPLLLLLLIRALSAAALHPLAEGAVQIMIAGPDEISKWTEEYRPRFDLLGAVAALKLDGVPVLVHAGLCDEFGMRRTPPGFDEAGIGGFFLKPGVGVLKKDRGGRYDFFHPYPVETLLKTESRSGPGELTFLQCVDDFHGFGYRYTKQYRFEADSSRLVIRYELINTGKKPIVTDQYNHNFFSFGKNLPGTQYRIRTDFAAKPLQRSRVWCSCRQRVFTGFHPIPPGCYLTSTERIRAAENRLELTHPGFPYAVEIGGDFDSRKFAISFKEGEYISPEIFVEIDLAPGEMKKWSRIYRFLRR